MGLKMDLMTPYGEKNKNIYLKITKIEGGKDRLFLDLTAYDENNNAFMDLYEREKQKFSFVPKIGEKLDNFINQAYNYLKTLDKFKNAKDC